MRIAPKRVLISLIPVLFFFSIGLHAATSPNALQTIDMPQGGRIVYGKVQGADTQGAAMTAILRSMHQSCGDKPQIGKVFKMRGTDSVGVFFTVMNHPAGNVEVAGLLIAAGSGAHAAEAALVSDRSDRFGQTINPMLSKLFGVWHPGGASLSMGPPGDKNSGATPARVSGGSSAGATGLHTVTSADGVASIDIPDGWTLDPHSGGGFMLVAGPNGETIGMNMTRTAVDPTNPGQQRLWGRALQTGIPGTIVYKVQGELAKSFPELFQLWRRSGGQPPAELRIDKIESAPAAQGQHCVHVIGHLNPDGKGMRSMNSLMCVFDPNDNGTYLVSLNHALFPNDGLAEKERPTLTAVVSSMRIDLKLFKRQMDEANARSNAQLAAGTQQAIDRIHQIGAQATARYNATQAANDAQHSAYWARQESNAAQHSAWSATQENTERYGQGFSNYLLDQTVIRDVQDPNTHATVWNRTAEVWQKAFPDRIEEVPTSQYIKGEDF
jgi:hypothetical protein